MSDSSDSSDSQQPSPEEILRAKLNLETSLISWLELQRHYAAGKVLKVDTKLDLVDVAHALAQDDKAKVSGWMESNAIEGVSDEQAKAWFNMKTDLWAVVVSPWVLVQDKNKVS